MVSGKHTHPQPVSMNMTSRNPGGASVMLISRPRRAIRGARLRSAGRAARSSDNIVVVLRFSYT